MSHIDYCGRCSIAVLCNNEGCPDNGNLCPKCEAEVDEENAAEFLATLQEEQGEPNGN